MCGCGYIDDGVQIRQEKDDERREECAPRVKRTKKKNSKKKRMTDGKPRKIKTRGCDDNNTTHCNNSDSNR
jgi:hypothetical protein